MFSKIPKPHEMLKYTKVYIETKFKSHAIRTQMRKNIPQLKFKNIRKLHFEKFQKLKYVSKKHKK